VDVKLDNVDPGSYADVDNDPSGIFFTNGFFTSDEVYRGFEDMGDEIGGGGNSKTHFFFANACGIANFIDTRSCDYPPDPNTEGNLIVKNLGNLYALGHSGLIFMGATDDDHSGSSKAAYTTALSNGQDFGEAYMAEQNSSWNSPFYALLGAGNLRAQPYVQYGSDIEENETISWSQTLDLYSPVLVRNVTVNGDGNWEVWSTNNSSSPFGTHSEIVVRPETDFAPTGAHMVHLWAHP
jgi:hypothetical protein